MFFFSFFLFDEISFCWPKPRPLCSLFLLLGTLLSLVKCPVEVIFKYLYIIATVRNCILV